MTKSGNENPKVYHERLIAREMIDMRLIIVQIR